MGESLISVKQGFSLRRAVFLHEVPDNCPLGALKSFSQIIRRAPSARMMLRNYPTGTWSRKAHILVIVDSLDQRTFWKAIQFRCKFLAKSFYHLGIVDDTKRVTSFIGALRPVLR